MQPVLETCISFENNLFLFFFFFSLLWDHSELTIVELVTSELGISPSSNTQHISAAVPLSLSSRYISEGRHQSLPNHAACPENSAADVKLSLEPLKPLFCLSGAESELQAAVVCFILLPLPPAPGHELPFSLLSLPCPGSVQACTELSACFSWEPLKPKTKHCTKSTGAL